MSEPTTDDALFDPVRWCALSFAEHRALLAAALMRLLEDGPGVRDATIQPGPRERPYDLTATLETDVGSLRTPLWSHARADVFCDGAIHPANRRQLAPGLAVGEAAGRLRARLAVPFALESRGMTLTLSLEEGVERVWTAERSRFRGRASVSREDRIANPGEVDLRDMLAHFYTGPALRVVGGDGTAFLLPAATEGEDAELVSLCRRCRHWAEGAHDTCPDCGAVVDVLAAARPPRR